mgnify:CR=1 FL=1
MPYIGKSNEGFGIRERFLYLASAGDTTVSGTDSRGISLTFSDPEYVDVYLNGVRLKLNTDYNLNTSNTVAGLTALSANDEVEVIVHDVFTLADMVSAGNGGTFSNNVSVVGNISASKDAAVLNFGADSDVTLTHVADTGLLLNSTSVIQFNDASQNIGAPSNTILDINATDEIELNATLVDVNANLDVQGTIVGASTISGTTITASTAFVPDASDGAALGTPALEFSDLFLADAGTIQFGNDQDVTLTHVNDTGVLLNSSRKLQFGDSATFIHQSSDGVMTIDGEATIDLNASTAVLVSNDLKLNSDAAVLGLGADNDVTLTHVADTGILLNSSRQLQFGDSGTHISQSADGVLDLVADTEIEINATTIDINGNVEVSGTLQVATITATTAFVPDASNGAALGTSSLEFSDLFLADGGEILFGVDQDVILRHDHNSGLIIDRANTSDNSPTSLTLQTAETDIAADDVIGVINFQAPDEGTGTDAILVAAGIAAVSEGDFAADNNATKLSFRTAASAAAAETMSLSSAGNLTVSGDASIGDDLTLASDASVLKFGADGDINITHVHNTGLTSNGTLDVAGDITGSTLNADGDTAAGDAAAIGYTAAEGLILTGQGSTNDVTIKNDADADVIEIPTGTVNVTMAGTLGVTGALTAGGILKTDDATDATSTTDGSLQTDGGLSVAKDAVIGDDLLLLSDSTVIKFGADSDITLTHAADTGLTANGSLTATTLEATADTAAGDNAAIGFTSAEGLILTGQGSTNDVTIKNDADADVAVIPTGTTNFGFDSGFGSAGIAFGVRAWVNFNGTGTVAIRDSGNVSSITDHGTGLFTANFATNMPDVNYCVSLTTSVQASTTTNGGFITALSRTTTPAVGSVRFETINSSFAFADSLNVNVQITR